MSDQDSAPTAAAYGEQVGWQPATPRLRPLRLVISWIVAAASIWVAAALVPGVGLESTGAAFVVAALIAVLNALLPPVLAALRLPYVMGTDRRLTGEEIDARHPELIPTLRAHPHIGWLLVRSGDHGAVVLGPDGVSYRVEGVDPLAQFSPTAARHLLRSDGFAHVADIMIGSFYDPMLDEGCAFEELISFHGGLGGPQTRAFILAPARLPLPAEPILGAAAVHGVLAGWRRMLQGALAQPSALAGATPGGGQQLGPELVESGGVDEVAGEQPASTA